MCLESEKVPGLIIDLNLSSAGGRALGEADGKSIGDFSVTKNLEEKGDRKLAFVWKLNGLAVCRGCPKDSGDYGPEADPNAPKFPFSNSTMWVNDFWNNGQMSIDEAGTEACKLSAQNWQATFAWGRP